MSVLTVGGLENLSLWSSWSAHWTRPDSRAADVVSGTVVPAVWHAGAMLADHDPGRPTAEPVDGARPTEGSRWRRLHHRLHRNRPMSVTTKLVVSLVGAAVLTGGLIMMVTPGPGLVGIVAGLAILATEWDWADRWLTAAKRKLHQARAAAQAMDPRVRRRRLALGSTITGLVVAAVVGYVVIADW